MAAKSRKKAWSLAAAARSARDARIAAVRHMREAPVERQWQAAVLAYGHQARTAATGDPEAARALLFASMGYPEPYPRDWEQASAVLLADEARFLAEADLYVLTPQMLDVIIAAAQTLTFADLGLLTSDDLPGPNGAVILPRPLITRLPTGSLQQDIAFTWRSPWRVPLPGGLGFCGTELSAVRMSGYITRGGTSRDLVRAARAQGVSLPPMLLDVAWSLPVHPASSSQARDCEHLAAGLRRLNNAYWQDETRKNIGVNPGEVTGEYASGATLDQDPDGTLGSRFLYAFWRLCEQQIAAVQTARTGHSAQVAAARAAIPPDVRVVALRRTGSPGRAVGQAGPHQWNHHWLVRMHKVRQWYPSLQQHKVIYRGPYVKGDMTKPLLGGEVVRGLVR